VTRKLSRRPCPPFVHPPPCDRNPARPTHASTVGERVVHERTTPVLREKEKGRERERERLAHVCVCMCARRVSTRNYTGKSHDVGLRRSRMLRRIICQLCVYSVHRMRSSCRMRRSDGILGPCDAILSQQRRMLLLLVLCRFAERPSHSGI